MELSLPPEVAGEVLIPLENGSFFPDKNIPLIQDIYSCSYKNFRKVLFQGESLKFYIVLKSLKQKSANISNFFDKILFKIDFEPNDIEKNVNINEDGEEMIEINKEKDVNFYSTNKFGEEKDNELKNNEIEFEEINNKIFDEESCSEIYEIIKEVIVPDQYINFNFLMKISLYLENHNVFSEDYKENNILSLYQLGIFDNINNFRYFKIFFKEVKIINALNILNMKQMEPKIDTSLIQTKLSNYNDNYDFYDISLKNSKIFKNMKNVLNNGNNNDNEEKNINISDIRIMKYETCFDENATEKIEFIKKILIKEKKLLNQYDYDIQLFNKSKFPLIIGSGEEFNLLFKITKNSYINESIYSSNNINKNIKKEKIKPLNLITKGESNSKNEINKIIINQLSDSYFHSSIFFNPKALEDEEDIDTLNSKKKNSIMIPPVQSKSISQKIQQPLISLGNLIKKKMSFIDSKEEKDVEEEQKNKINNENKTNTNTNSFSTKKLETIKSESNTNDIITEDDQYLDLDLDSYFDEQFRIYYITPIILELSSKLFYENINMCIHMKWFNEINRYLKISISIPEHIYKNQYFEIKIKIKNLSLNPMNLIVEIKDNENKETPIILKNKKQKNIENVPSILSQTKAEQFGLINCDEEKVFKLKFMPYIKGFCYLPNLTLIDIYSNKKFYIVQNNKIYVEEIKL